MSSSRQEGYSLDALDSARSQPPTPHRGTDKIRKAFEPLFTFFNVQQTGNIFLDFSELVKALEDPRAFSLRIFDSIFSSYDADDSGEIDLDELETLLRDIGEATGDLELKNLNKTKLDTIMKEVDTDGSGTIDKMEFIGYMLGDYFDEDSISQSSTNHGMSSSDLSIKRG